MIDAELDELARELRRRFGDRLPAAPRDESADERQLREERTRLVLERDVLPELAAERRSDRLTPLGDQEQRALVEHIISGLFGLPRLLGVLRDPTVTDVLVLGADPVRIEHDDGRIERLAPLVTRERDLERIIYETAVRHGRPFHHEVPFVDVELEPGVRFHGEGFDVVRRPLITIRRASLFGAALDDLAAIGTIDRTASGLLEAAVDAGMNVIVCGEMGSGKTTLLRALAACIDHDDVIVTVETDFELDLARLGTHPYVHAYQSRAAATIDARGISCADVMVPAVRTRADWIVVGEVRGAEGGALVSAMSIGQGAMATVHGGSAVDGLERLADLMTVHNGIDHRTARWQVYRAVDLVVHVAGDNRRGRWVSEIIAPSVEDDGGRHVVHVVCGRDPSAADERARPLRSPPRPLLERLTRTGRLGSDPSGWRDQGDTYRPLIGPGTNGARGTSATPTIPGRRAS